MTLIVPRLVFIEPVPLITVHSTGLAAVRVISGDMHFALFSAQPNLEGDLTENVVNHRQSMPVAGVLDALPIVIAAAAEAAGLATAEVVRKIVGRTAGVH